MKKKYTNGPWKVGQNNSIVDGGGYPVCLVQGHKKHFDTKLIAKAPEMADALEAALPYLKHLQCNISGCHVVAEGIEKIIKEIEDHGSK